MEEKPKEKQETKISLAKWINEKQNIIQKQNESMNLHYDFDINKIKLESEDDDAFETI